MKKSIIVIIAVLCALTLMILPACSAGGSLNDSFNGAGFAPATSMGFDTDNGHNYQYGEVKEQGFVDASETPSSYFSLDKNTAGYGFVRYQILNNMDIYPDSVRIEELVNYFDYPLPSPADGKAIGVSSSLMTCPWNEDNKLMMVGVKTDKIENTFINGNYVFLIDRSGSMSGDDRLGLAKKGINALIDGLGDNDVVSIVTYASGTELVVDGAECAGESNKAELKKKVNALTASGSTNGEGGIQLAYQTAQKHFITGGNNRVVLISDGDFNVGMSKLSDLKEFIQDKAASNIYLSVFGVGMGNTRDDLLETLARNGNGTYAYLDSEREAQKAFTDGLNGNLYTVAKDAKASVTFNTDNVERYRLIGYDTKRLSQDEYENDATDAGEIGSGLCVIALYEVTLKGEANGEIATAEVRYKDVRGEDEINDSSSVIVTTDTTTTLSERFAACVAEFGLLLRESEYKGNASYAAIKARLEELEELYDGDEYKLEFYELVQKMIKD